MQATEREEDRDLAARGTNDKLKRLVAFAILMESSEGIIGKAPYYVLEKFEETQAIHLNLLTQLLDSENKAKYDRYLKTWRL